MRPTLTEPHNQPRMKLLLPMAVAAALLVPPYALAQRSPPSSGPSDKESGPTDKEKAKVEDKRARAKEIDEAYKSTLIKIPDTKQKVDPWGGMRTAPKQ